MYLILMLGLTPLIFWTIDCDDFLFGYPYQVQADAAYCFSLSTYTNIILGVVIALLLLVFWSKYKKEICDCES